MPDLEARPDLTMQPHASITVDASGHATVAVVGIGGQTNRPWERVDDEWLTVSLTPPFGRRVSRYPIRGRQTLIRHILNRLDTNVSVNDRINILYGMAGCGKTSVALEAAYRATVKGHDVWWIQATDHTTLVVGLHSLARHLGATDQALQRGEAADVLWSLLLARTSPWLLVIDDVSEPGLLKTGHNALADGTGWVRPFRSRTGLLLVTTRDGAPEVWGAWSRRYRVRMLTQTVGAKVLYDYAGAAAGSRADAMALAQRLDGLPLALRLVGSYLAETISTPWGEREEIRTYAAYHAALDMGAIAITDDQDDGHVIGTAWELSLDLLRRRNMPHAQPLLWLLSCLADGQVPATLFLDPDVMSRSQLFSRLDAKTLWRTLQALENLGLLEITLTPDGPVTSTSPRPLLRVHPLVRDKTRDHPAFRARITEYLELASVLLQHPVEVCDIGVPDDPRQWPAWQLLTPHALHLLDATGGSDSPAGEFTRVLSVASLAARHLYARGSYEAAESTCQMISASAARVLGDGHRQTLRSRQYGARVLHDRGRCDQAEAEYRSVLTHQIQVLGVTDPDVLATRHNLADMLRVRGHYAAAESELREVLDTERQVQGDTHPDTLTSQYELARVLHDRGMFDEAENLLMDLLRHYHTRYGEHHHDTLVTRHNIGRIWHDRGRLADAEVEYRYVFATCAEHLGEDHPEVLFARHNVGRVCHDQGCMQEAGTEYQIALEQCIRVLGPDHPESSFIRYNIGRLHHDLGRLDDAEAEYHAALDAQQRVLGNEHRDLLNTRCGLARLSHDRGDWVRAEREYLHVLDLQLHGLCANHPDILRTLRRLVRLRHDQETRRIAEAEPPIGDSGRESTPRTDGLLRRPGHLPIPRPG